MFIVLVRNIVNGSNHTKCVLLSSQLCMTQPALINLHLNPNLDGGGGNFNATPRSWFSLNNSKTVKAVTLEFCIIQ